MKGRWTLLLPLLLSACGYAVKHHLLLTGGQPPPQDPIRIYFVPEEDLVGQYQEKLQFFGLRPLTSHLADAVSHDTIKIFSKPTYHSRPTGQVHKNFFSVVPDSASADLIVETGVDTFAYQSAESISDRLAGFWLLGLFSLRDEGPRGIVGATCRVRPTHWDGALRPMEFDVVGLSNEGLEKSVAFRGAFQTAGDVFVLELLRDENTGSLGVSVEY